MTTISLDTQLVQSRVPVLVGGSIGDGISRLQRPCSAMLLGVKDRFVIGLVLGVWLVKGLALFEIGSG